MWDTWQNTLLWSTFFSECVLPKYSENEFFKKKLLERAPQKKKKKRKFFKHSLGFHNLLRDFLLGYDSFSPLAQDSVVL